MASEVEPLRQRNSCTLLSLCIYARGSCAVNMYLRGLWGILRRFLGVFPIIFGDSYHILGCTPGHHKVYGHLFPRSIVLSCCRSGCATAPFRRHRGSYLANVMGHSTSYTPLHRRFAAAPNVRVDAVAGWVYTCLVPKSKRKRRLLCLPCLLKAACC
jgi:hypothetical protein